jgi:hypothetical protein
MREKKRPRRSEKTSACASTSPKPHGAETAGKRTPLARIHVYTDGVSVRGSWKWILGALGAMGLLRLLL